MRIRKVYGDCVTADGSVVIAYAARLGLGVFSLPYQAVLTGGPGEHVAQRTALTGKGMPVLNGRGATWRCGALDLTASWSRTCPSISRVLFESESVRIDWRCHMPSADAEVRVGGQGFEGAGYFEELRIRGSQAALPIRRLRWGRFLAEDDSVVWIQWRGPEPLTLVVHNGAEVEGGAVSGEGVCGEGFRLVLDRESRWTLRDELVEESVFPKRGWLRFLVPPSMARVREVKWAAPGSLERSDGGVSAGWALYEEVAWP